MISIENSGIRVRGFISSKIDNLQDFFSSGSAQMYSVILILVLLSLIPVLVFANVTPINSNGTLLGNYANPSFNPTNVASSQRVDQITKMIGAMIQDPSNLPKDSVSNETTNEVASSSSQEIPAQVRTKENSSIEREINLSEQPQDPAPTQQEENQTQDNSVVLENQTQTENNESAPSNASTESIDLINETELISGNTTENSNNTQSLINETEEGNQTTELNETQSTIELPENETEVVNETTETEEGNQTVIEIPELENETEVINETIENQTESNVESNETYIEEPVSDIDYPSNQIIVTQALVQGKIVIGEPVVWTLKYTLYNPTNETIYNHPILLNIPSEAFNVEVLE